MNRPAAIALALITLNGAVAAAEPPLTPVADPGPVLQDLQRKMASLSSVYLELTQLDDLCGPGALDDLHVGDPAAGVHLDDELVAVVLVSGVPDRPDLLEDLLEHPRRDAQPCCASRHSALF